MDPIIGEIRLFATPRIPYGWLPCNGQEVPIQQYQVLFALIANVYGPADFSKGTFFIPDLRGRAPIHNGQGTGLSAYKVGQSGGTEQVTLTQSQIPAHTHLLAASRNDGMVNDPTGNFLALSKDSTGNDTFTYNSGPGNTFLNPLSVSPDGGGGAHNNMPPFLTVNYCVAWEGIFPEWT